MGHTDNSPDHHFQRKTPFVSRDSVGLFRAVGNQFQGKIVAEGYAENSNWTLDRSTDP